MDPDLAPSSTCLPANDLVNRIYVTPSRAKTKVFNKVHVASGFYVMLMKVKSLKGSSFIFFGVESLGKPIKQRKINLFTVIGNENEHL